MDLPDDPMLDLENVLTRFVLLPILAKYQHVSHRVERLDRPRILLVRLPRQHLSEF